jgi:Domain of unknown function (DUF4365)
MELNRQKEQFGNAFLQAAAAAAGLATCKPGVDEDSVDWIIHQSEGSGIVRSPRLEVQLKCTAHPEGDTAGFRYALGAKNYRDLIRVDLMVPRILVLVVMPERVKDWLHMTDDRCVLRNCAYWASLRGLPRSENISSIVVRFPREQRFDADALGDLMSRVGSGVFP